MSYTVLTVSNTWASAGRYTASGATDVALPNYRVGPLHYVITDSDVIPAYTPDGGSSITLPVVYGVPVNPGETAALQLADGERLWVSMPTLAADATVEVPLHY